MDIKKQLLDSLHQLGNMVLTLEDIRLKYNKLNNQYNIAWRTEVHNSWSESRLKSTKRENNFDGKSASSHICSVEVSRVKEVYLANEFPELLDLEHDIKELEQGIEVLKLFIQAYNNILKYGELDD